MNNLNLYNSTGNIKENQKVYDDFNNFIFSTDKNIFNKLYSKFLFYNMTKDLNGDIIECGVFKGSGLLCWLKILAMQEPNSIKKAIGFDFFDINFINEIKNEVDKKTMEQVFSRCNKINSEDISASGIKKRLLASNANEFKFELVEGDIKKTSFDFVKERPGFRISILNMDLDLDEPTYVALNNFWPRIVQGGIIIFDEYAYHSWSEANAVDKFVKEKKLLLQKTNIAAPTAFVIKN